MSELEVVDVEAQYIDLMEKLEKEFKRAPKRFHQRIEAYRMRLEGYTASQIGEELGLTLPVVWKYWRWCMDNLPSIADSANDFIRISVDRLDIQYRQLAELREDGDPMAHRASVAIIEAQAKLLGVYQLKLDVTATASYQIEGVDMGKV